MNHKEVVCLMLVLMKVVFVLMNPTQVISAKVVIMIIVLMMKLVKINHCLKITIQVKIMKMTFTSF